MVISQGSDGTLKCWDNEMEDCRGEDAREFDSAWNHANSSQDPVLEAAQCAKTIMKWQAPPPLAYKINVDGAWAKESGNGSINTESEMEVRSLLDNLGSANGNNLVSPWLKRMFKELQHLQEDLPIACTLIQKEDRSGAELRASDDGTDDDLPLSHRNKVPRGARIARNGRSGLVSVPQPRMHTDMEAQIDNLEQDAYNSVLRAFKAQSDAITWAGLKQSIDKQRKRIQALPGNESLTNGCLWIYSKPSYHESIVRIGDELKLKTRVELISIDG
ncbi:hypothetical protein L1049_003341 [Liquidambar formosana]|uniref:ENT domain-containing protein n=1 Tax=Liquidambar formosana TaxID=63359 RepID=A0AAP0NJ82_LIQFO